MTTLRDSLQPPRRYLDSDGESIVEHVAGVEDYQVALATYRAACERWPGTPISLRQGARVIEEAGACAWCRRMIRRSARYGAAHFWLSKSCPTPTAPDRRRRFTEDGRGDQDPNAVQILAEEQSRRANLRSAKKMIFGVSTTPTVRRPNADGVLTPWPRLPQSVDRC